MLICNNLKISFIILYCLLFPCTCLPEAVLLDPDIPDGEKITYISNFEGKPANIVEQVRIKTEYGRKIYEITSRSEYEERIIRLSKDNLHVLYVHTIRKFPEGNIENEMRFIEKQDMDKSANPSDEVKVADFSVLRYMLRGFPFERQKALKLNTFGRQRETTYAINVKLIKKEKLKIGGKTSECYKLEIGIDGFWSGFIPKTYFWYSVEPPHYLVRLESWSVPGPSKRFIEILEYGGK